MRPFLRITFVSATLTVLSAVTAFAYQVKPPTVFLDKHPRVVAYQLGRLDDQRLLMVPRGTDDEKYIPVYEAIVSRPAMAAGIREEAFAALAELKKSSVAAQLLDTIPKLKPEDSETRRLIDVLTRTLLKRPQDELKTLQSAFEFAAAEDDSPVRSVAFAALVAIGRADLAHVTAESGQDAMVSMLNAVQILPSKKLKTEQRDFAIAAFENADSVDVKKAAIETLCKIPAEQADAFARLIQLVDDDELRIAACRALMQLPADVFQSDSSLVAANALVGFAESTQPANRTTDSFVDAMQLVDRLLTRVPTASARELRTRLREITVRVVKIGTVEEEMRYDVPYFVVEAGRPLQILLENHDLMPHNLVITQPGALKGVAMAGLAAGPDGTGGLPYVPDSPNVIAATEMIASEQSARLTINAPTEPGEYPYVCTFPQHWYRMYGVMVVVEDLDAWNQNPTEPADPIGSTRSFVQSWTMEDFDGEFDTNLRGRSADIGEKIFNEASCIGCHKVNGVGGAVGPDLTDTYVKWKSDHMAILREILEPSHKIDNKYSMQTILTADGKTVAGIVVSENEDTIAVMTNPEAKEPVIVLQDDIEFMKRSATSMMPKALMDQYTKDEILELMAYLMSVAEAKK